MTSANSDTWWTTLDVGSQRVTLVVTFDATASDEVARLRTPSFGTLALPLRRDGARLRFASGFLDIAFDLAPEAGSERLVGRCLAGGASYPVTFQPGEPPAKAHAPRPQTPKPPFPYAVTPVSFDAADGSRLAGTLTLPGGGPPRAAVILSAWFGRTDRDQRAYGHRPMAIWADAFTRLGLATLRYDKRGCGESEGDFEALTTADLTADLTRAVAFLRRERPDLPIGLLGHSEGGHVSADVAAADPTIAFCVMLTPTGIPEEDMLETELFRAAEAVGGRVLADPAPIIAVLREMAAAAKTAATGEEALARTRDVLGREAAAGRFPAERIEYRARLNVAPWRRHWLNYDHAAPLRALACPILVVFAERDLQTPPDWEAPPIRAALAGNPLAHVVELAGLNHCLQTAITGAPSEYGDIEQTLAPEAIATVCEWVARTVDALV